MEPGDLAWWQNTKITTLKESKPVTKSENIVSVYQIEIYDIV